MVASVTVGNAVQSIQTIAEQIIVRNHAVLLLVQHVRPTAYAQAVKVTEGVAVWDLTGGFSEDFVLVEAPFVERVAGESLVG